MIRVKSLVTVDVYYWIPDYRHILNEFIWHTDDVWPDIPRVHNFLNFWKNNIDAVLNEVLVARNDTQYWRRVDFEGRV